MKTGPALSRKGRKTPDRICDLTLYVFDQTPKSALAVANLNRICHENLEDKCRITLVDIKTSPLLAKTGQVVAVPMLEKTFPLPRRRVIGDLSNRERVLAGLNLPPMIRNDARTAHSLPGRP